MDRTDTTPKPRRMSFRIRLVSGYVALIVLLLGLGGATISQVNRARQASAVYAERAERAMAAAELSRASLELVIAIDEGILIQDSEALAARVNPALEQFNARYEILRSQVEERAPLEFAVANLQGFVQPIMTQAEYGSWQILRDNRVAYMDEKIGRLSQSLADIVAQAQVDQHEAQAEVIAAQMAVFQTIMFGFLLALLLGVTMAVSTLRSISRSVGYLSSGVQRLAAGDLQYRLVAESRDELGQLANSVNQMAAELESLYGDLEVRIEERTEALEQLNERLQIATEVGGMVTSILDVERLMKRIVGLIQERFGFYHISLFELDESERWLDYKAGAGVGAEALLESGLRLPVGGQSMVGWCAANRQLRVAQNVGQERMRQDHPILPETRSEAALPLIARGRVIGALSVQSDQVDMMDEGLIQVLSVLADQVAVALNNAQLFRRLQSSLEAERRIYAQVSREAWRETLAEQLLGYRYQQGEVVPLTGPSAAEAVAGSEETAVSLPIRVRGEVLGTIEAHKPAEAGEWSQQEAEILSVLVEQLGVALESARLYQDAQRLATREQLIGEVTARMRESLDLETVLQTAVRELAEALTIPDVELRMWTGAPDTEAEVEPPVG